jgi:molybdopterin synthase catalytic subunit
MLGMYQYFERVPHQLREEFTVAESMGLAMTQQEPSNRYMIKVSEKLPTLEECSDFVTDPSCGAISSFVGITRNNFQGKIVAKLRYEGYVPMAEKELRTLCDEATTKYSSIAKIAAVHILGDYPVGQASVILAASSPLRRDAMHCVEYLIDELKARIPIWKREVYEGDEGGVWKENIEWHEGKKRRVMIKEGG